MGLPLSERVLLRYYPTECISIFSWQPSCGLCPFYQPPHAFTDYVGTDSEAAELFSRGTREQPCMRELSFTPASSIKVLPGICNVFCFIRVSIHGPGKTNASCRQPVKMGWRDNPVAVPSDYFHLVVVSHYGDNVPERNRIRTGLSQEKSGAPNRDIEGLDNCFHD